MIEQTLIALYQKVGLLLSKAFTLKDVRNRTFRHFAPAVILGITILMTSSPYAQPPIKVNDEMKKLDFMIGSWDVEGRSLNKKGEEVSRFGGSWEISKEIGGQLIVSLGYSANGKIAQRNWKFFNKARGKLYNVNFDIVGNFEVREALMVDGNIAFSLVEPFVGDDGVSRDWRQTYKNITPNSFDVYTSYTTWGEKNWVLAFIAHYKKKETK